MYTYKFVLVSLALLSVGVFGQRHNRRGEEGQQHSYSNRGRYNRRGHEENQAGIRNGRPLSNPETFRGDRREGRGGQASHRGDRGEKRGGQVSHRGDRGEGRGGQASHSGSFHEQRRWGKPEKSERGGTLPLSDGGNFNRHAYENRGEERRGKWDRKKTPRRPHGPMIPPKPEGPLPRKPDTPEEINNAVITDQERCNGCKNFFIGDNQLLCIESFCQTLQPSGGHSFAYDRQREEPERKRWKKSKNRCDRCLKRFKEEPTKQDSCRLVFCETQPSVQPPVPGQTIPEITTSNPDYFARAGVAITLNMLCAYCQRIRHNYCIRAYCV